MGNDVGLGVFEAGGEIGLGQRLGKILEKRSLGLESTRVFAQNLRFRTGAALRDEGSSFFGKVVCEPFGCGLPDQLDC